MPTPYTLKGFPAMGRPIEAPVWEEFLRYMFFVGIPAEELRKIGGDCHRSLLDMAPITNSRKNVLVTCKVHYLAPGFSPVQSLTGRTHEWHIDAMGKLDQIFTDERPNIYHALFSSKHCLPEFLEAPTVLRTDAERNGRQFVDDLNTAGLKGKKVEPNSFVTFDVHPHRTTDPDALSVRLFFSVMETDEDPGNPEGWQREASMIYKDGKAYESIEVRPNRPEAVFTVPHGVPHRIVERPPAPQQ